MVGRRSIVFCPEVYIRDEIMNFHLDLIAFGVDHVGFSPTRPYKGVTLFHASFSQWENWWSVLQHMSLGRFIKCVKVQVHHSWSRCDAIGSVEVDSWTLVCVNVHPVNSCRRNEIMTAARIHDETSVLELDWHSDAHDVITASILSRDMRDNFLIAHLCTRVVLQVIIAVNHELDVTLGTQDDVNFINVRKLVEVVHQDTNCTCPCHTQLGLQYPLLIIHDILGRSARQWSLLSSWQVSPWSMIWALHEVGLHVLKRVHLLIEFDIHLDHLFVWHCARDEVIIVLSDQCWSGLSIRSFGWWCSLFALHAGVVFEGTLVALLAVALQPPIAVVVPLTSGSLRSSWCSWSAISALTTLALPLVPMVLWVTVLALVTMFAITLVEVEVAKGLRWVFGGRWSGPPATLALAFAMTLGIAGRQNWGSRLTFGCRSTWLSGLTILRSRCRCCRLRCRSSWLTKVGVVRGQLVSGCNVSFLTHMSNVSLHDL